MDQVLQFGHTLFLMKEKTIHIEPWKSYKIQSNPGHHSLLEIPK